jgi:K+/H+ antiporter YhaU regulatory subunit KhtT
MVKSDLNGLLIGLRRDSSYILNPDFEEKMKNTDKLVYIGRQ